MAILGAVFLCATGAEAMYAIWATWPRADPHRLGGTLLPALLLNYAGHTAALSHTLPAVTNPFFSLVPAGCFIPP